LSESVFQADLIKELTADGRLALKLEPGTGNIPKAWPDLLILGPGPAVLWCEVKDVGGEVRVKQRHTLEMLALTGFNACFCDPRPEYCHPVPMTIEEIREYQPPRRGIA
jgi:hypothetical protein